MLYKIRINQNSLLSPEQINNFFNKITNNMKKYGELKFFYNMEIGKKLKHSHIQGWVETKMEMTSRQIQYHKTKQKLKDTKNCHQITPCEDTQDEDRYRAYCAKDVEDKTKVITTLTETEIQEQMDIWQNVYIPQRITKPTKTPRAPEKLMQYLKTNEKNFIPCGDACFTNAWHAELLKEILNYYKIECIFLDSYVIKKAMCLALLTYDKDYIENLLQNKWEEYVEITNNI
jgi:hypothetical protein